MMNEVMPWLGWLLALGFGVAWWRAWREVRRRRRAALGAVSALRALLGRDYRSALELSQKYLPGDFDLDRAARGERGFAGSDDLNIMESASTQAVATAFRRTVSTLEAHDREQQSARRELEDVLASLQDSVLVVDSEARLRFLNAAAQNFFGVRAEDVLGAQILESLPSFGLDSVVRSALNDGQNHSREVSLYGAGEDSPAPHPNQRRDVLLRVAPVRRADGSISGAVAIVQDLTELRRLERVRRDFVANASHELRTPIANIRAAAETVLDASEDPTLLQRFLPRLVEEAERLSRLVSDLLDLARADSQMESLDARVDLARVASDVSAQLSEKARAQNIDVICDFPSPVWVMGDAASLEQVAFNLLDNALMYTPSGGRIELSAMGEDDVANGEKRVTLRVRDSGIGIPAGDLPRIFERFYRVDKARSRAQGGTGLGLAIVKHIVERHSGHVRVESEVGQGTTFFVALPAA